MSNSEFNRPALPPMGIVAELEDDDRRLLSDYGEFLPVKEGELLKLDMMVSTGNILLELVGSANVCFMRLENNLVGRVMVFVMDCCLDTLSNAMDSILLGQ